MCTAAHCSTLQHTATHCNTLQPIGRDYPLRDALAVCRHCILQVRPVHRNTLQHTATHCSTPQPIGRDYPHCDARALCKDNESIVFLYALLCCVQVMRNELFFWPIWNALNFALLAPALQVAFTPQAHCRVDSLFQSVAVVALCCSVLQCVAVHRP